MKHFIIKFCILFAIIDGFLLWYALAIRPNISGDMGALAKIPFGTEYNARIKQANMMRDRYVYNVQNVDSIPKNSVITIGDSYSQQDSLGYQQYMGCRLNRKIWNVPIYDVRINHPEKTFIRLVNRGLLDSTQIIIVETVERSLVERLHGMDFSDSAEVELDNPFRRSSKNHVDYAGEAMQKLRLMIGYRRPIIKYALSQPMFSHPQYHSNIFIYHSPFIGDTDLLFSDDSTYIQEAYEKLERLHTFADEHKIRMIYFIVPDKYDVYYPYIIDAPGYNMTLDLCPQKDYIVNPHEELRAALKKGEKDVYYLNDTHWSPIGAKIGAEKLTKQIIEIGYIR